MLATARIQQERQLQARDTSRRRHNLNSKNASNSRICVEKLYKGQERKPNMAVNVTLWRDKKIWWP
jgi:hypothetical protein